MSRDFHLTCATCDPAGADGPGRGADLNWKGDELLALISRLPAIAKFYRETGINPNPDDLADYLYEGNRWAFSGFGKWAAEHDGHDVRVRDEYGAWWPETPNQAEAVARAGRAAAALVNSVDLEGDVEVSGNAAGDVARLTVRLELPFADIARLEALARRVPRATLTRRQVCLAITDLLYAHTKPYLAMGLTPDTAHEALCKLVGVGHDDPE